MTAQAILIEPERAQYGPASPRRRTIRRTNDPQALMLVARRDL